MDRLDKIKSRQVSAKYIAGGKVAYKETIDDVEYKFIKQVGELKTHTRYFLDEIIKHDRLFEEFPTFKKIIVTFEHIEDDEIDAFAETSFDINIKIRVGLHFSYYKKYNHEKFQLYNTSRPEYSKESVLLHEIQHVCQFKNRSTIGHSYDKAIDASCKRNSCDNEADAIEKGIWLKVQEEAELAYKIQPTEQEAMWCVDVWLRKINLNYGNRKFLFFDDWLKDTQSESQQDIYSKGGEITVKTPRKEYTLSVGDIPANEALKKVQNMYPNFKEFEYKKNIYKKTGKKGEFIKKIEPQETLDARWQKKKEHIRELSDNIRSLKNNITRDLASDNEKDFLTALIITIITKTGERIGNDESASEGHHGVTGFRTKHISVTGNQVELKYIGKSGVKQEKTFSDEKISKALKKAMDKKSSGDFVFRTSGGQKIGANQVNNYLKEFKITAKDLRGYFANKIVLDKLKDTNPADTDKKRKGQLNKVLKFAAAKVGHGAATLKKHYLMPEVVETWIERGEVFDIKEAGYVMKKGGEIQKIVTSDGSKGGMFVGPAHSEGGMRTIISGTGEKIEVEGKEPLLVPAALKIKKRIRCKGVPKAVVSAVNEMGGGANFSKEQAECEVISEKKSGIEKRRSFKNKKPITNISGSIVSAPAGSAVINKTSAAIKEEVICEGTPGGIASAINEIDGNGVKFAEDGTCKSINRKKLIQDKMKARKGRITGKKRLDKINNKVKKGDLTEKEKLENRINNLTKLTEHYQDILQKFKKKKSNTIDGKFYSPNELRSMEQSLPSYKEEIDEAKGKLKNIVDITPSTMAEATSVIKKVMSKISKKYNVTPELMYSDKSRFQIVSRYFNTLLEIKRDEFGGNGLIEKYGNLSSSYVLYSPNIYADGGSMSTGGEIKIEVGKTYNHSGGKATVEKMYEEDGKQMVDYRFRNRAINKKETQTLRGFLQSIHDEAELKRQLLMQEGGSMAEGGLVPQGTPPKYKKYDKKYYTYMNRDVPAHISHHRIDNFGDKGIIHHYKLALYDKDGKSLGSSYWTSEESISETSIKKPNYKHWIKKEEGGSVSPLKQVKANQNVAITEVIQHFSEYEDLNTMEGGMLYNLRDKEGSKEVSDATGLKEKIYKNLEDKIYIDVDYNDYTFTLTDKSKQFIDRVNNRLETRREVKSGRDLFPETSNIPEIMAYGGFVKEGDYYVVSYKFNPSSHTWHRGYIKPRWSERATIPVIIKYDLYDDNKKTIVKSMTPIEAEKLLFQNKIVAGSNIMKSSFQNGGSVGESKQVYWTLPKTTAVHNKPETKIIIEKQGQSWSVYLESPDGEKYWMKEAKYYEKAKKIAEEFKNTIEAGYEVKARMDKYYKTGK